MVSQEYFWGMQPDRDRALHLAKRQVSEFVFDAVNLEGINMTMPEVQTLLDGVTVGGHALSDQQVALNQISAWRELFRLVERDAFELTTEMACKLHAVAGKEESLTWGVFRDGSVRIGGTSYLPPPAKELPALFKEMASRAMEIPDIYDRAIFVFLEMARTQFFHDVNKRMGRFMMNGLLLQAGYPAINLPSKRRLEFHQEMLLFYESHDHARMNTFLRSCLDGQTIKIMCEPRQKRPRGNGPGM